MYRFPKKTELLPLLNQEAIQICCTKHQITIHFDRNSMISIEGDFVIEDGDISHTITHPLSNASIVALIENRITDIEVSDEGWSMSLYFTNKKTLRFCSNEQFETLQIRIQDMEHIA